MRQFVIFWPTGASDVAAGHNFLDACWNSGIKPEQFRKIIAYREGDGNIVQFALQK